LVLDSYDNPKHTFEVNVMGTLNLLDLVANKDYVQKIVIATSDKVYRDKGKNTSFIESDPLGGKDPYSWSKIGTEAVIGAWQQLSMLHDTAKIIAVRAGNVIGGGDQSPDRLLPDLIKGFMNNSEVFIRNPESTRPWQHVLDPLHGYLLLLNTHIIGDAYNFSTNSKSLEVKRVVEIAQDSWGSSPKIIFGKELSQIESRSLSVNAKKAIKELNWWSHWSQEEAIVATIHWWKSVATEGQTALEACFQQIEELLNEI
jgi:CDP-glucose 4,6-dehydratase